MLPASLATVIIAYSCASQGSPDGGPYDEDPPKFVTSSPRPFSLDNHQNKLTLEFDEYVKIEKASEKVVVSPPQLEQPEIKVSGKNIIVNLIDTIKDSVTYTVDFADAIVDNNESNPMGNFTYSFSTYGRIDTMEVSGVVLSASDLEPVKGMMVGLHANLHDSVFTTLPFDRVSRTDSRGHFIIRGVAPGRYRIFALNDGNQNYLFDSKTEMIAFSDSIIVPSQFADERPDTVWTIDSIVKETRIVPFTHYLPDDIVLRAFKEIPTRRYMKSAKRDQQHHFVITFSTPTDTLPALKGLNFDVEKDVVLETTARHDSLCYWIKDSVLIECDSLVAQLDYYMTDDSLNVLVPKRDTIFLTNKVSRAQREKLREKEAKKKEKERKKREKRGDTIRTEPKKFLNMKVEATGDLSSNVVLSFTEPIEHFDTSAIKLQVKVDTLWQPMKYVFRVDTIEPRRYEILAPWEPENEYQLRIDSAAVEGIYGLHTNKVEQTIKTKKLDEYATLFLNIRGAAPTAFVELLDNSGKVLRKQILSKESTADFYFLQPGQKYYVRLVNDLNGNGIWDTGEYSSHSMPEDVFYFPKTWEMKANFEFEENWDVFAVPLERQKPYEILRQKPEKEKKVKNKNQERLKNLGRTQE